MGSDLLWTLIALQILMGGFDTLYHHGVYREAGLAGLAEA